MRVLLPIVILSQLSKVSGTRHSVLQPLPLLGKRASSCGSCTLPLFAGTTLPCAARPTTTAFPPILLLLHCLAKTHCRRPKTNIIHPCAVGGVVITDIEFRTGASCGTKATTNPRAGPAPVPCLNGVLHGVFVEAAALGSDDGMLA